MLISEESIHFDPKLTLQNHPWMSPRLGCQLRERNKLRWQHGSCVSYSASISCFSHFVCPRRLLTWKRKKRECWRANGLQMGLEKIKHHCSDHSEMFLPAFNVIKLAVLWFNFFHAFSSKCYWICPWPDFFFPDFEEFFHFLTCGNPAEVQCLVRGIQGSPGFCLARVLVRVPALSMFICNGPNSGNLTTL